VMDGETLNTHLRKRIKEIRLDRHLTVTQVAHNVGMPISSYSSLETGAYHLTLESLQKILAALRVDIADVWPPFWHQGVAIAADGLNDVDRLSWFRLREIFVLSHAEAVCLVLATTDWLKLLGSISFTDKDWHTVVGLLSARREQLEETGWRILERTGKQSRLYLCLKQPELSPFLVHLARLYLCIWDVTRDI
jgi:transcriptional regulator with XRE-family HTH domain